MSQRQKQPNDPHNEMHIQNMRLALTEALSGYEVGEVAVGCVFICSKTGKIVAKGHNTTKITGVPTRHCEMNCLADVYAMKNCSEILESVTAYVTVEPCIMCTSALRLAGVRFAVFGCMNNKFGGCGSILSAHSCELADTKELEIVQGVLEAEASGLLRKFYGRQNVNCPFKKRRLARNSPPI